MIFQKLRLNMKYFSYLLITISTSFYSLNSYAEPSKSENNNGFSFESYKKSLSTKIDILDSYLKNIQKFKSEKRQLTVQESYDSTCSIRNSSETTLDFMNQYPEYKKKLNPQYIQSLENIHKDSLNSLNSLKNYKCTDEQPPYSPYAKWKELPSLSDEENFITYIDTDNYRKYSPINDGQVVNIKMLFKENPEYYAEADYLIFCKTKEYMFTRTKTFIQTADGKTINKELKGELPSERKYMDESTKRIFDYKCK